MNVQEVFRSELPVGSSLLVIFVPSRDRSGQPVNQDYWVDENLATLGRLFRGSTAYPRGRGVWRNDAQGGVLIKEEPVIVFSYIAEEAITQESLSQVYRMLARMGRETNQGEIGIVLDGKYYGITDFSAE